MFGIVNCRQGSKGGTKDTSVITPVYEINVRGRMLRQTQHGGVFVVHSVVMKRGDRNLRVVADDACA